MGAENAVFSSLKISTQMIFTTLTLAVNYLTAKPPFAAITKTARTMCQIALFSRWIICRNCAGCQIAVRIVCYMRANLCQIGTRWLVVIQPARSRLDNQWLGEFSQKTLLTKMICLTISPAGSIFFKTGGR